MLLCDLLCAVVLDLLLGDPPGLPHPIRAMGWLIAAEERLLRRYARQPLALRPGGGLIVLLNLLLAFGLPFALLRLLRPAPLPYHALNVYLLYTCLAARCLRDEALKVAHALQIGIDAARQRLAFIVGRDPQHLTAPEIIRATVETVAENASDGVIAPLLYALIGGVPLALAYKMVNTMDSMLGYQNERYKRLGFFPAKVDDVWNYLPARLTGLLLCGAGGLLAVLAPDSLDTEPGGGWTRGVRGVKIMLRDRKNHKSPNCAYPEGAVAGILGVQLGGANVYFGQVVEKPTIGDSLRPLEPLDIRRTTWMMFGAEGMLLICWGIVWLVC